MSDPATSDAPSGGYQVVVSPSRLVRPVPAFVFAAPSGWVIDEAPGAIAVVRAGAPVGEFWDNALITHDRVARAVDLQAAATASWARLVADAPSATVMTERVARFGDNVVYLRGVELDAPQSGKRLAQVHAVFFAPIGDDSKTADLFQIVGTSTVDNMEAAGQTFAEIVASFRFI